LSSADWTSFNGKISGSGVANQLTYWNGTGSVTGSAGLTYVDSTGVMTLSKNQNETTKILISNTTSNTNSATQILFTSDALTGTGSLGKFSTGTTPFKTIAAKDYFIYNQSFGDISILNDFATGKIKFASGGSSTAQMTLTAAGRLLLGTTTESTFLLDVNGTARVSGTLTFANTTANVINVIDYGNGSGFASSGIKLLNQTGFYSGFTYLSSTGVSYLTYRQLYFAGNQTEATATTANSHAYFTLSGIFTTNNEINAVGGITSSLYKFPSGNNVASGIIQWPNVGFKTGFKLLNATTALAAGFIYDGTSGPSYLFGRGGQNFLVGIGVDDTNMTISNATFYIDATNKFIINKQTSINDASPSLSAIFNISSTTQGFLPPRMTSTQRNAIGSPAQGLMLFDTTLNKLCVYSGTSWETITSV
jgi:hypothetical protein